MTPTIKSTTIAARSMAKNRGMARAPICLIGSCGGYRATVADRVHRGQGCQNRGAAGTGVALWRGRILGDTRRATKLIGAVLLALALSLGLAAPVAAGPYEDAGAAYERGDYATALLLFPHVQKIK
jgi:hypothetical protein